jgi:Domain of unknown function (DUF1929)
LFSQCCCHSLAAIVQVPVKPLSCVLASCGARLLVTNAVSAEMWDPATEKWSLLDTIDAPRTYHSVALLLPDGRVFSGGGGLCGACNVNHFNGQIFSPPNLFGGARPTITVSVATALNGQAITVKSNAALKSIAIIRFGSATHATNSDQRRLELCGLMSKGCGAGNQYNVQIPGDPGAALELSVSRLRACGLRSNECALGSKHHKDRLRACVAAQARSRSRRHGNFVRTSTKQNP